MYEYIYQNFLPVANLTASLIYLIVILALAATTSRNVWHRRGKNWLDNLLLIACLFGIFAVSRYVIYNFSVVSQWYTIDNNRFLRPSFPFAMLFGIFCTALIVNYQLAIYHRAVIDE